jgi:hypothetical protein
MVQALHYAPRPYIRLPVELRVAQARDHLARFLVSPVQFIHNGLQVIRQWLI